MTGYLLGCSRNVSTRRPSGAVVVEGVSALSLEDAEVLHYDRSDCGARIDARSAIRGRYEAAAADSRCMTIWKVRWKCAGLMYGSSWVGQPVQ